MHKQGGGVLSVRLWRDMAPEELADICRALCGNVTLIAGGMEVATEADEELALRLSENPAVYWVQVSAALSCSLARQRATLTAVCRGGAMQYCT